MGTRQEFARIQSPSSINTFKQCPRKYFYQYVEGRKTLPSIHLVRGKIAHSVLEDFFKLEIEHISEQDYDFEFKIILHELLSKHWTGSKNMLGNLGLRESEVSFYLQETKDMLQLWLLEFLKKLSVRKEQAGLAAAFRELTPLTEKHLISYNYGVQGYIDAIFNTGGKVKLIDYKTSKHDRINDAYRLQLAIYALLYEEKYDKRPDSVGIHFLKFCEKELVVDDSLIEHAREECTLVHASTCSKDISDYPQKRSPLCRWSSGQCDFYDICMGQQKLF